jgi:5-formyltetrahydrofolate cyclo-ligase
MQTFTSQKIEKSTIRKELRERRRQLNESERQSRDASINGFLADFIAEHDHATIAAFWPFDGEPNLLPTLKAASQQGIEIVLPVIPQSPAGPSLIFRQWSEDTVMKKSHYGIPEPFATAEVPLFNIDLILMPLVGWDESGGRLGMGAGYYDRALQPFSQSDAPIRAAVAYQLQKVSSIPLEPWDIRLHMVLSETGWFTCPS